MLQITPAFLDELRSRLSVSDVVGRRVRLIKKGREFSGLCPFHNEKTPSFTVNDDKAFYHCFGCGAHGDVIKFVQETEGLSFPEAVEKLAREAGLEVPQASPEAAARAKRAQSLQDVTEAACAYFEAQLRRPQGRNAAAYLDRRGVADDWRDRFRLGFAPDSRDGLKSHLMGEGVTEAQMIEAGLLIKPDSNGPNDPGRASYDRFRGRLMFPITDRRGRVVAFGGRILGDGQPKYLNSPETPLFHKGEMLYGLAQARQGVRDGQTLIVTEGYMDVIALHQAGFSGAVAPLGTALTESQIAALWRLAAEPVLCFDGDNAGQRAAARAAERALPHLQPGRSLLFSVLPQGEDPDTLVRGQGRTAMEQVITAAVPLVDWLWQAERRGHRLDTPERQAAFRKALRDIAARIEEKTVQNAYATAFDRRYRALFRDQGAAAWQRRRDGWSKDRPLDRDTGLRSDGNVDILFVRQVQALLAVLLNQPSLREMFAETLGQMDFATHRLDDLERLRVALVDHLSEGLDSEALKAHLTEQGHKTALAGVLSVPVYEFAPLSRPDAAVEQAADYWRAGAAIVQQRGMMAQELRAAEGALAAAETTDTWAERWAYLAALKQAHHGDDDGDAAGASADDRVVIKNGEK